MAEEGFKVDNNLVLGDGEIVIEEVEQLFLHEVDLCLGEHLGVSTPVFVLGRRIIEVLGGDDESGEEDSVSGAWHTLGDFWKTVTKSLEVDERGEEGGDLDVGLFAYHGDERLEGRQTGGLCGG